MELHLLIAESRRIYRKGLRDIFARDSSIASIDEATTAEELSDKLAAKSIGAVIVNQSLITDVSLLPEIRVIIIATQPDRKILLTLSEHGLSGYFLDEPDEELLRFALHDVESGCLLDPRLTGWALHLGMYSVEDEQNSHLTTCERDILTLRKQGLTTSEIAQRRSISRTTVKTHLRNAVRKLRKR